MLDQIERKLERQGSKFTIEGWDLPKRYSPLFLEECAKTLGEIMKLVGATLSGENNDPTRITGCEVRNDVSFPGKMLVTPHIRTEDGGDYQEPTAFCAIVDGKIILPANLRGDLYLQDILDLINADSRTAVLIQEASEFDSAE